MRCIMPPLGANIHVAIQGVLVPQWAVRATTWAMSRYIHFWTFCVHNKPTLCQWHVQIAIQCVMCPQWALGATILQHHVHLAIQDVLGPQWALGATMWITSRSIHFQTFYVPNEPWEPHRHIHLAVQSTMCPHWASGATRLQHTLHLAVSDVLAPYEP